jgi:hypothetical protein
MKATVAGVMIASVFALGLAVACGLRAQEAPSETQRLRSLREQRHMTLKKRLAVLEQKLQGPQPPNGSSTFVQLLAIVEAHVDLLDAELELAESKVERIEVLKKRLRVLREQEERLAVFLQVSAKGALEAHLFATAQRLRAEIDLLRAVSNL